MIYPSLPRHAAIAGIALGLSLSTALAAQAPAQQVLLPENAAGSYLAARHAGAERDSPPLRPITSTCSSSIRTIPIC